MDLAIELERKIKQLDNAVKMLRQTGSDYAKA